ncbi:hypothetical protein KM043_017647 [Ampulex compressa]|nr:hypothetical protein KM043_017647 [Ampulex compressa]
MNKSPLVLSKPFLVNNTRYRNPKEEFPPFKVNYFVAHFRHNSTMQYHVRIHNEDLITLGLCLPASCSIDEIDMVLKRMFHNRTLLVGRLYSADFKLVEVRDLKDDQQWLINGKLIFVGLLLVTTCVIMLISTMYDIFVYQSRLKEKKKHVTHDEHNTMDKRTKGIPENVEAVITIPQHKRPMEQILMCFSIYTNTKKIFNTDVNSDLIHAIHGLRFLGMVWIILVHTIFYVQDYGDNMPWAWRMSEGFAAQIISNSTLSVDTYFFLSGYLLSYVYLCSHKDKENYKLIDYRSKLNEILITIVKRFIRLTPAYMMMIGIVELNMGWYSNTSLFYMTERPQNSCAKYWWRNLLYINNLFRAETMCVSWSWYLSNDMQFFIIGIFLLNLMSIYLYAAMIILGGLLFGSILLTGYISYIYEYVPTLDTQYQNLDLLYYPPWTRIGPYIVGILAAYILIKLNKKLELKKRNIVICWLFGSSCNILVLFGLWERHISVVSTAFYVGLSRTVWGVGLAWIVIACQTNHGGIINQILSFKGWIPLSRLTYCAYLLNPFIINSVYLYGESSIHVDFLSIGTAFMGNVLNSYFCAYMLSLMFEMPYIELLRILFYPRNKRK